ncbi:HdeD family acid-resistance protein [Pseudaestuariivita atlantica]|uniref:HdeD family acid-resistance protein n=1 Tax=Pseudaestuariivita atlantica TaxID=1317121 RepID=A0A0L1JUG8_9RHOB|nr:DUF308 domain-containing protein [Pseudaestuariivita atlantica]KNG95038.1 hypothetical protein ATO11_04205 [Pseudaestuariivita atlantica]
MTRENFEVNIACTLSRNWWAFVLRGVVALIIAVLAFLMPAGAVLTLTILFGAFAFADGVFGLISAVRNIRQGERWGWLAASGVLGVLTGIIVIVAPMVATLVLAAFLWASIAFWSVVSGMFEIATAIRLRKEIEGEVWLGLSGVLSVLFGVAVVWLLMLRPAESLLALGWLLGLYAAIFGIVMLVLGLKLRRSEAASGEQATS